MVGSKKLLFELAGEHHDMSIVNRVNRMKFDCHFPSYASCVLLFKESFSC